MGDRTSQLVINVVAAYAGRNMALWCGRQRQRRPGTSAPLRGLLRWLPGSYFELMRVVGIKVLKDRLSEYVRMAAAGERVLVTDRDRVVAELGPPRDGASENIQDALLAEAVRNGWLRPPMLRTPEPPASRPVMTFDEVMGALGESRDERF